MGEIWSRGKHSSAYRSIVSQEFERALLDLSSDVMQEEAQVSTMTHSQILLYVKMPRDYSVTYWHHVRTSYVYWYMSRHWYVNAVSCKAVMFLTLDATTVMTPEAKM